jgi:hypothetical protein
MFPVLVSGFGFRFGRINPVISAIKKFIAQKGKSY